LAATGARPEQLIASTFRDVYPQYSPHGERIVFYSSRGGSQQIWMADADGARPRQITWMQAQVTASPHWSPDGETIAFASNQGGQYQVYTVSAEGGAPKRMTMGESSNSAVTWSRDGQWMYFASNRTGRSEVWKMPAAGGEAVQVTKNGGVKLIESADRRTLFYSKDLDYASVWSMPAGGGEEVMLFRGMYMRNFALTKQGIYYMNGPAKDATATLRFYSFETGESAAVAHIGTPEYGLDVSPDGRYLVYAQMDDRGGDLMLVEHFR
jgi:Tol biopolymer transport system component